MQYFAGRAKTSSVRLLPTSTFIIPRNLSWQYSDHLVCIVSFLTLHSPCCSEWRVGKNFSREYDCLGEYVRYTKQVIAKVAEVGFASPKIFRTTTSSWMKFGNHHVDWGKFQDMEQGFLQSR
jgi:hypothetical protein